jgi:hypothetical protein
VVVVVVVVVVLVVVAVVVVVVVFVVVVVVVVVVAVAVVVVVVMELAVVVIFMVEVIVVVMVARILISSGKSVLVLQDSYLRSASCRLEARSVDKRINATRTMKMITCKSNLYFGVLHPVAHTLSRLLEEPSLATILQGVYFIFYVFAATCFGPRWPSSGGIQNYFREVASLQRIRCFVL